MIAESLRIIHTGHWDDQDEFVKTIKLIVEFPGQQMEIRLTRKDVDKIRDGLSWILESRRPPSTPLAPSWR